MKTNKISDFKLAEYLLRTYCTHLECTFVDIPVVFKPDVTGKIEGGILFISNRGKLSKTLFQIVAGYLKEMEVLGGRKLPEEAISSLISLSAVIIKDFASSAKSFPDAYGALPAMLHLNRDSFVWLMMRNVICPSYAKPIKNVLVYAVKSDEIDGAKFIDIDELDKGVSGVTNEQFSSERKMPSILLNMEIENYAVRVAFMLSEAINGHGLDSKHIIRDLLFRDELSEKLFGLLKIAFPDKTDVNDFLFTLAMLGDLQASETQKIMKKTAQFSGSGISTGGPSGGTSSHTSFWQIGLIEKMLERHRGMHWDVYLRMKPFTDHLNEQIAEEKLNRGMKELPIELLLRVQSEKYNHNPDLTIQGLLADSRVW